MNIGERRRTIHIEPIEEPAPVPADEPSPSPAEPAHSPEPEPAGEH